jgi:co-chaperonin GroES (HSP10)
VYKYQPLGSKVLIKADKSKSETASGLLIHEDWKSLPLTGKIVAIGPMVSTVEVGQRVMFGRYGSIILEDDLRICLEGHIYGIETS